MAIGPVFFSTIPSELWNNGCCGPGGDEEYLANVGLVLLIFHGENLFTRRWNDQFQNVRDSRIELNLSDRENGKGEICSNGISTEIMGKIFFQVLKQFT